MAYALLSAATGRILGLTEKQARYHVNLVRGAEKEVHSLAKEMNTIRNVLVDAENRRFHDKNINCWLSSLEQASYEMEDVLDEWDYALLKLQMEERQSDDNVVAPLKQKVCCFIPSSWCVCFKKVVVRHSIAKKIINVKAKLDEILKEKDRYGFVISHPKEESLPQSWRVQSTSLIDTGKVHGRDRDRDIIVSKLVDSDGSREESNIHVVSIVGAEGLGKTTLAQLVYNNSRVEETFELRVWVCVSDPFDLATIAKGILECIKVGSSPNTDHLEVLLKKVKGSILGKKFLLVLDDVWTEDSSKWEPLENSLRYGGAGSKILVTTRNERVVKMMGSRDNEIYHPGLLSDEDCWLIFHRIALSGRNKFEFEYIGREIVKKCNGLPLATKTLGSLLRFKNRLEEWENILNSEIWKMKEAEIDIFPHLLLSYNELSPTLKRCFSYCVVFPKDFEIGVDILIEDWMSLGYLGSNIVDIELKGRECFELLAMRSLFQDFQKYDSLDEIRSFKMHDIVHDFDQFVRKSGMVKSEPTRMNKPACQTCDPLLVFNVNEFCSLYPENKTPIVLCDCLVRLRVLRIKNRCLRSIPRETENLIHLKLLRLEGIFRLSSEELKIIFQLYYLQTLILVDCNSEEIPREIQNLAHLERLDLCGNLCIKELPGEIENLIHLSHLKLTGHILVKELPKEIGNLIQLRYLTLNWNSSLKKLPREIGNLIQLRCIDLWSNEYLEELPTEIGNLIHLTRLDLSGNNLKELPTEIGHLIHLTRLDLGDNNLKELPKEIGDLTHLTCLNLTENDCLKELPESIRSLKDLKILENDNCASLCTFPEGLAQLTSLHSLSEFKAGSGWNRFELLKNLNHLSGSLTLVIKFSGDDDFKEVVEDARKAGLKNKIHIEKLQMRFVNAMNEEEEKKSSRVLMMDVFEALEPHPNLQSLYIYGYDGLNFPLWMVSSLNQLKKVYIHRLNHMTSLPCLGKLPCLEKISVSGLHELQILGREFFGITTTSEGILNVAFPKLKKLKFDYCSKWIEWEDITAEEEESAVFSIMPCLTKLTITYCYRLKGLPHRLLRKVSSLEVLKIYDSLKLEMRYTDEDDSDSRFIFQNNPRLRLSFEN